MKILARVWKFAKAPVYKSLDHVRNPLKLKIVIALLKWGILIGVTVGMINQWWIDLMDIDLGQHAIDRFLDNYSIIPLFFIAAVFAPLVEEILFRGPLVWFKNKKYFQFILYGSVILFAGVHMTNFEMSREVYYIAPLLVAPQLILGMFLSYVRVKLGLRWSICLHAMYNGILLLPILLYKFLNIPLE
ncbi:CPBP family intramembrane glutamic endopeptidase [Arenibacter sp. F20364]|uniref:CPBP family intramembrane glutamic endopeptidase n=1 Tax=Arenibacter sp. F20364 TaxID=2926415 RepID=UPI001FF42943|nr:CPBP family intramembrane glutamic endopeptidase [Arenibacter sp. F20364]MCK0191179.1 CPBP family intramembrane metalloprotease [Arenibacter sp. F20364]